MSKDLDWVDYFDQAYYNAVVHGTGFIRVSVNGPEGLNLSVVDPKDYRFLTWVGLTDEEMLMLEETTTCTKDESWLRNLTRAIEAKLKEKNT